MSSTEFCDFVFAVKRLAESELEHDGAFGWIYALLFKRKCLYSPGFMQVPAQFGKQ